AMRPHHRPSHADGIDQPWPGLLVGGPNSNRSTDKPARQWKDEMARYDLNENAINWNAPLVFVLAEAM
ncbi:MAG TPA: glycoside hydrolase family 9 protein, partial [Fimbriimonas sp.]|nr:glycoside hydrolase family 9 protein [Fimbriimonas sp.]